MRSQSAASSVKAGAGVPDLLRRVVLAGVGAMLDDERFRRVCEIEAMGVSPWCESCRWEQNTGIATAVEDLLAESMLRGLVPFFDTTRVALMVVGGMGEVLLAFLSVPEDQRRSGAEPVVAMARAIGLMIES